MNKEEKKLYKKIEDIFNSVPNIDKTFTRDDNLIIDRWLSGGILNKDVFEDATSFGDTHKLYLQKIGYPFTPLGESKYKLRSLIFFDYLRSVFIEGQSIFLLIFDLIGILLLFVPSLGQSFFDDAILTRAIGGAIFFISFLWANYNLYKKLS